MPGSATPTDSRRPVTRVVTRRRFVAVAALAAAMLCWLGWPEPPPPDSDSQAPAAVQPAPAPSLPAVIGADGARRTIATPTATAAVFGWVRAEDGAPIDGAQIVATHGQPAPAEATTSRADGFFSLRAGAIEPRHLDVRHDDFLSRTVPLARDDRCDVVLQPRPRVAVRVFDAVTGVGIERVHAAVFAKDAVHADPALPLQPSPDALPIDTEAGRFVRAIDGEGHHFVEVWADGYLPTRREAQLTTGRTTELALALRPGVTVRGVVVDRAGSPVADAWVALQPTAPLGPATLPDECGAGTDADGRFVLPTVAAGSYTLLVDHPAYPRLVRPDSWFGGAATATDQRLVLAGGAAVTGFVRPWQPDRTGEVVFTRTDGPSRRARIRDDGSYHLEGLTPGPYRVAVQSGRATTAARIAELLAAAATGIDLELHPGRDAIFDPVDIEATLAVLHGEVVGHPRPDELRVVGRCLDQVLPPALADAFTTTPTAAATFTLEGLPPGRWSFAVRDRDGSDLQTATVDLAPAAVHQQQFAVR